ncbi:hypothetical protein ABC970_17585 [Bacillus licheniformis]|uniref:hypothetical protein n=1 Tax=Bacillus TaxID=1386 RepID=UPI0003A9DA49|nr:MULTISPECIES: hypothetical protein [Bacillus]MCD2526104.1 hypothetical protein [Bacillus licheniformis]MDE1376342.1 hypothetical protein [Bacillus licheniformis]MDE1392051.1 hypothetical protein [Bacillus paralicheniformis]MDE1397137.1 hypothetical protein [Bacillus licheniformis]MEC1037672.1 hypothetical protein [Bacillus licheniformis]
MRKEEEKKEILMASLFISVIVGTVMGVLHYFLPDIKNFLTHNELAAAICFGGIFLVSVFFSCILVFKDYYR